MEGRFIVFDTWKERIVCELTFQPTEAQIDELIRENNTKYADNEDMLISCREDVADFPSSELLENISE